MANIPLYICATYSLSIHLSMDTEVAAMSWGKPLLNCILTNSDGIKMSTAKVCPCLKFII